MNFGWIEDKQAIQKAQSKMVEFSLDEFEEKDTFLYKLVREVTGSYWEKQYQKIGDCVSWTWAKFLNCLQCLQIKEGEAIEYNPAVTEAIYGLSRVEIGKQFNSYQDGSVNVWAAQACQKFGSLGRKKYGPYDPNRAKLWGAKGLPDNFEPEAAEHKIQIWSTIRTFTQAARVIAGAKTPVAVASNKAFVFKRDKDGFCAPNPRDQWPHSMIFMGVVFGSRPGLYCDNHWGAQKFTGPTPHDMPPNGFFIDAEECDQMFKAGDSQTASKFSGYKIAKIDFGH